VKWIGDTVSDEGWSCSVMVRVVGTEDVLVEIPSEERMGDTVTEDGRWEPYGSRSGKLDGSG
jgi:hypothetical protein